MPACSEKPAACATPLLCSSGGCAGALVDYAIVVQAQRVLDAAARIDVRGAP